MIWVLHHDADSWVSPSGVVATIATQVQTDRRVQSFRRRPTRPARRC